MPKVRIKKYLHSDKESNWDLVEQFGHKDLAYTGYEVELLIEIDTKTGESQIVGCDGHFLDRDQSYAGEEITEITGVPDGK